MCDGQSTVQLTSGQWPINSHEGFSIASWKQQWERVPLVIFFTLLSSSFIFVHLYNLSYLLMSLKYVFYLISVILLICTTYVLSGIYVRPFVRLSHHQFALKSVYLSWKQASGSGHQVSSTSKRLVCASDWATTASMYFPNHSLFRVLLDAV